MSGTETLLGHLEPADRPRTLRMKFLSLISAMIKVQAGPRYGPLKTRPNKSGIYIQREAHLHSAFWGAVKDAISEKAATALKGVTEQKKPRIFGLT